MKLVKLNKTHNLYHHKCTHAFKFYMQYDLGAIRIRNALIDMYGRDDSIWKTFRSSHRRYWIGVTDEKYLTLILLKLDN